MQRQAIDQINADRLEATGAGGIDHQPGFFLALDAVDRLLHFRLKILHPYRHAVKAQFGQQAHGVGSDFARVDLDREFAASHQMKVLANRRHQPGELGVVQKRGCAAAKMQLRHLAHTASHRLCVQSQLFFDIIQVCICFGAILGDHLVTSAVVADGVAKRQMHIQRQRPGACADLPLLQPMSIIPLGKTVVETICRWIRRVARAIAVKIFNQCAIELTASRR